METHRDNRLDATSEDVSDVDSERTDPAYAEAGHEGHATTGGAALAGAATGGAIGLAGGPVGAAVGAVGGAIVGAIAERVMHSDDEKAEADVDDDRSGEMPLGAAGGSYDAPGRTTMELREEELTARKQMREKGEVELRKNVVEEQRSIDVPISREEVVIERRPVNREVRDAEFRPERDEVRVQLHEEDVTMEKRPVVTEEVHVGKREVQDTTRISGTVRHEEAVIDREGDVRMSGDASMPSAGREPGMPRVGNEFGTRRASNVGEDHTHSYTDNVCACGDRRGVV